MARDENNGEVSFLDRFMFATGKEAWKEAHRSARCNQQPMYWFAGKRLHTSRQWGDSLNMWSWDRGPGRYEWLDKEEKQYLVRKKRERLGMPVD